MRSNHLAILAALAVALSGCKKDEDTATPTTPTTGTFKLGYGFHWGTDDFDLANTYTDGNGHAVQFTLIKFYLGEPELMSGGNEVAHFHTSYFLADAATGEGNWPVGSVPAGSFDTLNLVLGVDSALNHADPTTAAAPLNDATMHWNWNPAAGYVFLMIEGRVDDDGDGVVDASDPAFTYHCATDDAFRTVALPMTASVAAGGTMIPHMEIHVNDLITGVDMLAVPSGMGYAAVNAQLMDNLTGAVGFE